MQPELWASQAAALGHGGEARVAAHHNDGVARESSSRRIGGVRPYGAGVDPRPVQGTGPGVLEAEAGAPHGSEHTATLLGDYDPMLGPEATEHKYKYK